MKKLIFIALPLVICMSTTDAQIKVVDDDYRSSLTAAKQFYEQDVSFEKIFPRAYFGLDYTIKSKKDHEDDIGWPDKKIKTYNSIEMSLPKNLNCLGDTLWNYSNMVCPRYGDRVKNFGFGIITDGEKEEVTWEIPIGYYVVSGYIIGRENLIELLSMHFNDKDTTRILHSYDDSGGYVKTTENYCGIGKTRTIKQLKEEVLVSGLKYLPNEYIAFVKLSSIDSINGQHIDYYTPYLSNFFNVRLFTEIKDKFLNREVLLLDDNRIRIDCSYVNASGNELLTIKKDKVITDALTHEKIMLQDVSFIVKDVVVRLEKDCPSSEYGKPHLYVVLEGKNTGSFAVQANSIKYVFKVGYDFMARGIAFDYNIPHIKCEESYYCRNFYLIRKQDLSTIKQFVIDTCNTINNKAKMAKQKEENERISNQKRIEQNKKRNQEERCQRIFSKYGEKMGSLICDKKVAIGMTQEMCRDAWGKPMNTYRTTTKYGKSEVWCYNYKTRIYFFEGKVVQIDD